MSKLAILLKFYISFLCIFLYFKHFTLFERSGQSFMDKSSEIFNEAGEAASHFMPCKECLQGGIFPLAKRSDYFLFSGAVHLLDSNTFCYIFAVNLFILDYHLVSGCNISKGLRLFALFYNSFVIC